jgi:DNA repair protein RecN (Recombination protein N)
MLAQLTVRNFALLDSITLEFQRGFNVLTGETGAGKSILIDALSAALGERAGPEVVRTGADRAVVEAVFEVGEYSLPAIQEWAEEGTVILSREISVTGRSTFRINGRMCTAGTLREIAADLIDIHGQHDHQSLLSPERHVEFLDAWAGKEIADLRRRVQELYADLRTTRSDLERLISGERDRARQLDLYRFQIDEIDSARVVAGEEEELLADRSRLANAEKLAASAAVARDMLDGGDRSGLELLAAASHELEGVAALDPGVRGIADLLETAVAAGQEAAASLRDYSEQIEFNPERLEQVQERLELYRQLKRKYGDTVEEIATYRDGISSELDNLTHSEERRDELQQRFQRLSADLDRAAAALLEARNGASRRFDSEIAAHLADLSMAGTRFSVELRPPLPAVEAVEKGLPAALGGAEFMISANPGEPLRPLARIASGGEMSRVMLALKTAMAGSHPVALIFDEIDAGVGGRTAEALGAKMAHLSSSNQVLCVTHLPQIASMAGRHFGVRKGVSGERTVVGVDLLEGEARVGELARMLGGSETTAVQHARELLAAAGQAGAAR